MIIKMIFQKGKIVTEHTLKEQVYAASRTRTRPDGSPYRSLGWNEECMLRDSSGQSLHTIECYALSQEIIPERYSRNQRSLSCADQLRLLKSQVAIIGLGGLGGTVTDLLARLGVGHLTLVDEDVFDESNINRQLLSSLDRLGKPKADCAAEHVRNVNPAIMVRSETVFFSQENGTDLLAGCNLAIDCLDTIGARFDLQDICCRLHIPMISAAVGGTSGQATVIFPGDAGLFSIYGSPERSPSRGIEATLGTLSFAATTMAALECAEAVTVLLERTTTLRNKLLLTEIAEHEMELVELPEKR